MGVDGVLDFSDPAVREQIAEETPADELRRWKENWPVLLCGRALEEVDLSVDFDGEVGISVVTRADGRARKRNSSCTPLSRTISRTISSSLPPQAYVLSDHSWEEEEDAKAEKDEKGKKSSHSGFKPPAKLSSLEQTLNLFTTTQELAQVRRKEVEEKKNLPGIYLRLRDRSMREGYRELRS